ncbi:thiopeptide maturation pyridine synthase [Nonomuraea sp. NPDC005501]|uniref:thiopeptide maturation pyridine synthase n=1 Tax=Nonomuraea sp. NPDC005501 TaxID=3156884 RepID=UPI0033A1655E
MDWNSIHVRYYDHDKDPLILHGVRPLFRELAGRVDKLFYTRHWRQGPHLRLNFRTDHDTFTQVVWPAAEKIIGGCLAERPSTLPLDPGQELSSHQRLAELERETGPLTPWFPDNTLRVAEYDDREEVLGGEHMAELVADFYADTTGLAFAMTEAGGGARRRQLAFKLMVATAHRLSGTDISQGYFTFRSHAEAFLSTFPEARGMRPLWDGYYREHRQTLLAQLRAVLGGDDVDASLLSDWVAALIPYQRRGARLLEQGAFVVPTVSAEEESKLAESSPFHRAGYADPVWAQIRDAPEFLLYRLMLNLTYLHLTRLGLAPVERFLLCHLLADTVETYLETPVREGRAS